MVDATDTALHVLFPDLDDEEASAWLGISRGGLDYWAAAIRETFEESGLLIGVNGPEGAAASLGDVPLHAWRTDLHESTHGKGGAAMLELCRRHEWSLVGRALTPIAHWITPVGMPKRFDTRFFLAVAPNAQDVRVDGYEMVDHRWAGVSALLGPKPPIEVQGPTRAMVAALMDRGSVGAALEWAASIREITTIQPRLARNAGGKVQPVHPSHASYAEIGRIDPYGRGDAHSVIRPGVPVELIENRLVRITANNGSMMTGPGTNTYLLRSAVDEWVLIDPGPNDDAHVEATLSAMRDLGGRLTTILVTHTHIDHSPAARALKAATGAQCFGRLADHLDLQDAGFTPDKHLRGGERLAFGSDCVVRVIHTPGHASNHLCYLLQGERILFTGDHVMQGSTVIVNPPDGDMDAYLTSLERLVEVAGRDFDAFAPGHGFLMEDAPRVLAGLIAHRLRREEKVRSTLAEMRSASLDDLVVRVYDDVDVARHRAAKRSLAAHLLRLERLGQARQHEGRWLSSQGV